MGSRFRNWLGVVGVTVVTLALLIHVTSNTATKEYLTPPHKPSSSSYSFFRPHAENKVYENQQGGGRHRKNLTIDIILSNVLSDVFSSLPPQDVATLKTDIGNLIFPTILRVLFDPVDIKGVIAYMRNPDAYIPATREVDIIPIPGASPGVSAALVRLASLCANLPPPLETITHSEIRLKVCLISMEIRAWVENASVSLMDISAYTDTMKESVRNLAYDIAVIHVNDASSTILSRACGAERTRQQLPSPFESIVTIPSLRLVVGDVFVSIYEAFLAELGDLIGLFLQRGGAGATAIGEQRVFLEPYVLDTISTSPWITVQWARDISMRTGTGAPAPTTTKTKTK